VTDQVSFNNAHKYNLKVVWKLFKS
jgi:hypothetical protein